MSTLKDLETLKKYLTDEELKDIAKSVAYESFKSSIGSSNSKHRESNYEYYLKQGSLEAVREHISDFDAKALTNDLQNKTRKLINSMSIYDLPDDYRKIATQYIEDNKKLVIDKINKYMVEFVNGTEWDSSYSTFTNAIGETLADILYNMLEQKFKKENENK